MNLEKFFQMELIQIVVFMIKLILLFISIAIVLTIPFLPKVILTQIKKINIKYGQMPSVNYLPDNVKKDVYEDKKNYIDEKKDNPNEVESSLENDIENTRKEKRLVYKDNSLEELREMAKELGASGTRIKKYYQLDKESLIEAIIQTEEMVSILKAAEEAEEEVKLPDDGVN